MSELDDGEQQRQKAILDAMTQVLFVFFSKLSSKTLNTHEKDSALSFEGSSLLFISKSNIFVEKAVR